MWCPIEMARQATWPTPRYPTVFFLCLVLGTGLGSKPLHSLFHDLFVFFTTYRVQYRGPSPSTGSSVHIFSRRGMMIYLPGIFLVKSVEKSKKKGKSIGRSTKIRLGPGLELGVLNSITE